MAEDYLNLRAVTLQAYKRLLEDPQTQAAAYGVAALVIRNATQCPLKVCCALLDDWLEEEERQGPRRKK